MIRGLTCIAVSTCCEDTNENEAYRQKHRNQKCRADLVDNFDSSENNQAEHNCKDNTIHLKVMYTWALHYFRHS